MRLAKRRAALWIAIFDLADIWSLETVTQKLSELADKAVNLAWCAAFNLELRKGKRLGSIMAKIIKAHIKKDSSQVFTLQPASNVVHIGK